MGIEIMLERIKIGRNRNQRSQALRRAGLVGLAGLVIAAGVAGIKAAARRARA